MNASIATPTKYMHTQAECAAFTQIGLAYQWTLKHFLWLPANHYTRLISKLHFFLSPSRNFIGGIIL